MLLPMQATRIVFCFLAAADAEIVVRMNRPNNNMIICFIFIIVFLGLVFCLCSRHANGFFFFFCLDTKEEETRRKNQG